MLTLLFILIACLGMLVQSTVGFAGALLAVPLFSLLMDPRDAVPIYVLVMMAVNPVVIWESRRHIQWPIVRTLLITALPANFLGVWALDKLPSVHIKLFVSVVTLTFGILFLLNVPIRFKDTGVRRGLAGLLSGFLGGCIAASGPPVVIYALAQEWKKEEMRATLLTFYFLLNVSTSIFALSRGMVDSNGAILALTAIVPVILVSRFGIHLKNRLSELTFRRAVLGVILFVGVLGIVNLR
jgi:uncharacterized membrane protein YfcA